MSGSSDDSGPLDRKKILAALTDLEKLLKEKGLKARLYIVGGAAMIMAHRSSRTTWDVDALLGRRIRACVPSGAPDGLPA